MLHSLQLGIGPQNTQVNSGEIFEFTDVKCELGGYATPFVPESFPETLALCQRYYQQSYLYGTAPGTSSQSAGIVRGWGDAVSSISGAQARLHVPLRISPATTIYDYLGNPGKITIQNTGGARTDNLAPNQVGYDQNCISARFFGSACAETWFHYAADAEI